MRAADLPVNYNAAAILEHNLAKRPDKVALYSETRNLTFQAVSEEANKIGNGLKDLGVRFGECVGILAPDSPEWVTSFFGTIKLGAIANCMNTSMKPEEYDVILRDSRLRVLIVHQGLLALIESIRDRHRTLQHVVVIGQPERSGDLRFHDWIQGQSTELQTANTHRDDFCSLHYSSGTTGQPKGMFHAHKDYPLIAQNTGVDFFGLSESDRTFSVAKLFFVYGLGGNLVFPWYVGASIVLFAGAAGIGASILDVIQRFRPTVLYSVPSGYLSTLGVDGLGSRYDLSSLRLCISAGEALPATVWKAWKERTRLEILDTVGCTETFHTFMANRPGELRPGSSGKPTPGYDVRLVDDTGNDVPQGEIGNILVNGESTTFSYLHDYEKSRQVFRGEWLATGDKFYMDADGFYWHAGRSDDMFKVSGLWVSPIEVESALISHSAVRECAVIGQHDKQGLTRPKAIICLNNGYAPSDDLIRELLRVCVDQLAAHKRPNWFTFVDELPKTATGKIKRYALQQPA